MARQNRRVQDSVRGRLLVATPPLLDPNFERTVVLMIEHNRDGALGVVLNRPARASVAEVLPRWADLAAPPGLVLVGGPVEPEGMIGLGRLVPGTTGDQPAGVHELWPGVGTVDLEGSADSARGRVEALRCFAGYAGWGPAQLDRELATGSWFVVDAAPGDLWSVDPAGLWRAVLGRQPARLAQFVHCPPDPSTN